MADRASQHDKTAANERGWGHNPFFPMALFSVFLFILTILAMVAVIFSDPRAPIAKFLDAHGGRLIAAEVVVTLIVAFVALVIDRLQARRAQPDSASASDSEKDAPAENDRES